MRAIERWFDLLHLRRQPGDPKSKTVNFVGHSMGGAALFYLDVTQWGMGEQPRVAHATPRSVTARPFAAMGVIEDHPPQLSWDFMRVVLGHRDVLVGLIPMIDLLQDLA